MPQKRLLDHLTSNSLLNPIQSAYTKFYFTETTLISYMTIFLTLSLSNNMQTLILLTNPACYIVFLPCSAFPVFTTVVHSIDLIPHISRSHHQHISSLPPLTLGVPKAPFSSQFFSIFPLSSINSASSISHLLYADDTQLFILFSPKNVRNKQPSVHYYFHLILDDF